MKRSREQQQRNEERSRPTRRKGRRPMGRRRVQSLRTEEAKRSRKGKSKINQRAEVVVARTQKKTMMAMRIELFLMSNQQRNARRKILPRSQNNH